MSHIKVIKDGCSIPWTPREFASGSQLPGYHAFWKKGSGWRMFIEAVPGATYEQMLERAKYPQGTKAPTINGNIVARPAVYEFAIVPPGGLPTGSRCTWARQMT